MACGRQDEGSTKLKKSLDNWKYPKIPIDQVYKKNSFRIFTRYAIKDFEQTIALKSSNQDVSIQLLTTSYLKGLVKNQHKFLHLGLVQIAIKPLIREGLEAPIIVCLRDARQLDFKNSLLAIVESNLSKGPFFFSCFPSFSVSLEDLYSLESLRLNLKTGGVPLALTCRIVCKAMVDLSSYALQEVNLGETSYYHANANSGSGTITKWDDVQVPESWTCQENSQVVARRSNSSLQAVRPPDGRAMIRFQICKGCK